MIYIREGSTLKGQFQTENGTSYPANWCELSSSEDKQGIGIVSLTEIYDTLDENEGYDENVYTDDMINFTRTYHAVSIQ